MLSKINSNNEIKKNFILQTTIALLLSWMFYSLYRGNFYENCDDAKNSFIDRRFLYITNISAILTFICYFIEIFTVREFFLNIFTVSLVFNTFTVIVFWTLFFYDEKSIVNESLVRELNERGIQLRVHLGLHLVPFIISVFTWYHLALPSINTTRVIIGCFSVAYIAIIFYSANKSENYSYVYPFLNQKKPLELFGIFAGLFILIQAITGLLYYLNSIIHPLYTNK